MGWGADRRVGGGGVRNEEVEREEEWRRGRYREGGERKDRRGRGGITGCDVGGTCSIQGIVENALDGRM